MLPAGVDHFGAMLYEGGKNSIFSKEEERVLFQFNKCCMELRGCYDEAPMGLMKIRDDTLQCFFQTVPDLFKERLLEALLRIRPHWEDIICSNGDSINKKIIKFFRMGFRGIEKLPVDRIPRTAMWSFIAKEDNFIPDKFCIAHPDREVFNKAKQVCQSCYQKLVRLNLMYYPLDWALVYVLQSRKKHKQEPVRCKNHIHKLALGNGLCIDCNTKIHRLQVQLRVDGVVD